MVYPPLIKINENLFGSSLSNLEESLLRKLPHPKAKLESKPRRNNLGKLDCEDFVLHSVKICRT